MGELDLIKPEDIHFFKQVYFLNTGRKSNEKIDF